MYERVPVGWGRVGTEGGGVDGWQRRRIRGWQRLELDGCRDAWEVGRWCDLEIFEGRGGSGMGLQEEGSLRRG